MQVEKFRMYLEVRVPPYEYEWVIAFWRVIPPELLHVGCVEGRLKGSLVAKAFLNDHVSPTWECVKDKYVHTYNISIGRSQDTVMLTIGTPKMVTQIHMRAPSPKTHIKGC